MYVSVDQVITSRDTVWFVVVEDNERFTNEDEYEAKFKNNEPFDENGDPSMIIEDQQILWTQIQIMMD